MKTLCVAVIALFLSSSAMAAGAESFDQLVREGQTALDTMRPQYARALFDKAAALEPDKADSLAFDRAWTYVETGWLALNVGDYKAASERFDQAVKTCPDVAAPISEAWGFVRIRRFWELAEAASPTRSLANWNPVVAYAERTAEIIPDWPAAHYTLGCAYECTRQDDKARREFLNAAPNAPKGASLKALHAAAGNASGREHDIGIPMYPLIARCDAGDLQVYKDGQFTVYHRNLDLAQRTVRAMRYYMAQPVLNGFLDKMPSLPAGCTVWLYRDRKEFVAATGLSELADGCAKAPLTVTSEGVAAICLHQESPKMLTEVLAHELGHMRFRAAWLSGTGAPSWIDEGIAVSAEPPAYTEYRCRMFRSAGARGKLPSVQSVFATTGTSLAYAESFAMVNALMSLDGPKHFAGFVDALHRMDDAAALKAAYGMTPEGLQKLALEWAAKQAPDAAVQSIASAMNAAAAKAGKGGSDVVQQTQAGKGTARASDRKAAKAPAGKKGAKSK